MNWLKKLLGMQEATPWKALYEAGAIIVDVRSPGEFASGNWSGSRNIPLPSLAQQLKKLPKGKPIIVCCASGMRSASAKNLLQKHGFDQVYNAGSWTSLERKLL